MSYIFEPAAVTRSEVASMMLQVVEVLNALRESHAQLSAEIEQDRDPDKFGVEDKIDALIDRVESFMKKIG